MWYDVQCPLRLKGLVYNFLPSWWNRSYGVTFGKRFAYSPDYRAERMAFMTRTIAERFPELCIGDLHAVEGPSGPDFGNAMVAAAAGCEVFYPEDNYVWSTPLPASKQAAPPLPVPLEETFPFDEIIRQTQAHFEKYQVDTEVSIGHRGVLNEAVLIFGDRVFGDLYEDPEEAVRMLDYAWRMNSAILDYNRKIGHKGTMMLANCTVEMISAQTYEDWLFSYDLKLCEQMLASGMRVFLHHCGVVDRFLPAYGRLPGVTFVEIGWGSDIAASLKSFPGAWVRYLLDPAWLLRAETKEVRETVTRLLAEAGPELHRFALSVSGVEYGTPDASLREILACCRAEG